MNKNNKLFRRLFCIGISIFSLSIISFSLHKENNPNNQLNLFNNNVAINEENIVKEAKIDTLFPVTTIRKVTNDRDAINLIFMGDYFTDPKEFSDMVFNKRVDSWFNTGWINPIFTNSEYMSKVNAYSIATPTPQEANIREGNGWLGVWLSSNRLELIDFGRRKSNFLLDNFANNFLDSGSYVDSSTTNIIGKGGTTGVIAVANFGSANLTNNYHNPAVALHELCHSIFLLCDEYLQTSGTDGPNRQRIKNLTSIDQIKWKEFLSFRGIQIIKRGDLIPSYKCLMGDYPDAGTMPCAVCTHHIAKTFNNLLQRNDLYIADPQLTTKHVAWNESGYSNINWDNIEIHNDNITNANNKELEFRTVIDNWTGSNKKIKLRIKITDSSDNQKFIKESEIYEIIAN